MKEAVYKGEDEATREFHTILLDTLSFEGEGSSFMHDIDEEGLFTLGSDNRWEAIFEIH